jgi:hypothetical protein
MTESQQSAFCRLAKKERSCWPLLSTDNFRKKMSKQATPAKEEHDEAAVPRKVRCRRWKEGGVYSTYSHYRLAPGFIPMLCFLCTLSVC